MPKRVKLRKKIQVKAEAVTEVEGGLSSLVGEGPSPTRQDEDRPAQDSAGPEEDKKRAFETNARELRAAFKLAALVHVRRWSMLRRFVRAGRKIVARLIRAGFGPCLIDQRREAAESLRTSPIR